MKKILSVALVIFMLAATMQPVFAAQDSPVLPSGIAYEAIEAAVDDYVAEHTETMAALSVAIFTGDEVLLEKAYGYIDLENEIPNGTDAVFEWGSNTKILVWVSVMQLVEQGKIRLDADIREYLPEGFLRKLRFDSPITVLNLMNHTAGWQEVITDIFVADPAKVRNLESTLRMLEPEQVFAPGTTVAYSNWGAALAGYLVERVSGQTFADYVHEHIFTPLGMQHTAILPTLEDNPWVAEQRAGQKYYTTANQPLGSSRYAIPLYPSGMATGTLADFIKFGQAFLPSDGEKSPLFAERETLDAMLSPSLYYADGATARNAHGFWIDYLGVPVLWHNGGTKGSASWFSFDPVSGTGMITLANQPGEAIFNVGLLPLVFGKYPAGEPYSPTASLSPADDISGLYIAARTTFRGFSKPYTLLSLMAFQSEGVGRFISPGAGFSVTLFADGKYLLDQGGLKQSLIFVNHNAEGRKILQFPGVDYLQLEDNGLTILAQLGLLLLFVLVGVYALITLIVWIFRRKKSQGITGWARLAVLLSILAVLMLYFYFTVTLFSGTAMLRDLQWAAALAGLLALVPVIYTAVLVVNWGSLNASVMQKVGLALTAAAGWIMTINVIVWETFKFW